jgi:hypothetical protein
MFFKLNIKIISHYLIFNKEKLKNWYFLNLLQAEIMKEICQFH